MGKECSLILACKNADPDENNHLYCYKYRTLDGSCINFIQLESEPTQAELDRMDSY